MMRRPIDMAAGARNTLLGDRRGAMAVFIAHLFPLILAVGLIAIDAVRAYTMASIVSHATQMAAFAASQSLYNYYTNSSSNSCTGGTCRNSTITGNATSIGGQNANGLSNLRFTVTLGNYNTSSSSFTSLPQTGGSPNAVQVDGTATINTILAAAWGTPTMALSKTVYGMGTTTTYNVIVLTDAQLPAPGTGGTSMLANWVQYFQANLKILDCVKTYANSSSKFGASRFVDTAYTDAATTPYLPLTLASSVVTSNGTFNTSTNTYSTTDPPKLGATSSSMVPFVYCFYNSLKTAPYWRCNASNPAGAIYSARSQFSGSAYVGSNNNIILITNQLPYDNTKALTTASWISSYGTGVTTTTTNGVTRGSGSSTTALCGAGSSPSQNCSNTLLKYMAQGQAIAAGTAVIGGRAGINLSTIYYSGDAAANIANTYAANTSTYATPDSQTGAATEIGSWIQNSGVAATTATLTALPDVAKGVCLASFPTVTAMPLNTTTH